MIEPDELKSDVWATLQLATRTIETECDRLKGVYLKLCKHLAGQKARSAA